MSGGAGLTPEVQLYWWRGCPSWERALELLRSGMRAAGLDERSIEVVEVTDEAEARRHGFPGSPTIRVDGADVADPGPDPVIGLSCRVYRRRDGRISPLPDPEDLSDALRARAGAR